MDSNLKIEGTGLGMLLAHNKTMPSSGGRFRTHAGKTSYPGISVILICIFATLLVGCQNRDTMIAGVSIPVPYSVREIPDKGFDKMPGFEDGQEAFQGKVAAGEMFRFYQENMESRGWKPTSFMVSNKNQLAYIKGNRICLVWYTPNPDGTTSLIIMIGTSKPPA